VNEARRTDTELGGLVEGVAGAAAHDTSTRERPDRVLARLSLGARVLIQRTLVYVFIRHTQSHARDHQLGSVECLVLLEF